jgi:hypothetical protein
LDGHGAVNVSDLRMALRQSKKIESPRGVRFKFADVNPEGKVYNTALQILQKPSLELPSGFHKS